MSEKVSALEASLDLLRRLPPQNIQDNVMTLLHLLAPHERTTLLSTVDLPSPIRLCPVTNREYLICDYNRDGDAYRSPWSNEYDPPQEGGCRPSERLRKMEIIANEAFDTYRNMYYEGGVSSVYFWEAKAPEEDVKESFMGAILLKKISDDGQSIRSGCWDAIHIIEATIHSTNTATFQLTTTIILHLDTNVSKLDSFGLAGQITRQHSQTFTVTEGSVEEYVVQMGRMVEEMESRMRGGLQEIYFGKTHDLVNEIRPVMPAGYLRHQADLQREMAAKLMRRREMNNADNNQTENEIPKE